MGWEVLLLGPFYVTILEISWLFLNTKNSVDPKNITPRDQQILDPFSSTQAFSPAHLNKSLSTRGLLRRGGRRPRVL